MPLFHPSSCGSSNSRGRLGSLLLLAVAGSALNFGLNPSTPIEDYRLKTWTTRNGLPATTVSAVTRSKTGFLWLGTQTGLVRFDGLSFSLFDSKNLPGLSNAWVMSLLEDRNGRLWTGLYTGLAVIDGQTAKPVKLSDEKKIPNSVVELAEDRDGAIWVNTLGAGIYSVKNGAVQHFTMQALGQDQTAPFGVDSAGGLWTPNKSGLVKIEPDGRLNPYPILDEGQHVMATFEGKNHDRWAVTSTSLYRLESGKLRLYLRFSSHPVKVRTVTVDSHGTIWCGSNEGLFRIRDRAVDHFGEESGLAGGRVYAIREDPDGSLWVGSEGGLNCFRDREFAVLPRTQGRAAFVWSVVAEPDGGTWLATTTGAMHVTSAGTRTYTTRDGLPSNYINCVERDRAGAVWIGTDNGLCRWKNGAIESFPPSARPPAGTIGAIHETRAGTVLANGRSGRSLVEYKEGRFEDLLNVQPIITSMADGHDGAVLLSSALGIIHWRSGARETVPGTADQDYVFSYQDTTGTIWALERLGSLVRIKDGKAARVQGAWPRLYEANGLVEDASGVFWLTTNHGLLRVPKKQVGDYLDGVTKEVAVSVYTIDDGLPTDDSNGGLQNVLNLGADGRIRFATPSGAVVFDPRAIRLDTIPPPTIVEAVTADGAPLTLQTPPKLRPTVTRLEFQYTGADFRAPQQMRFRYRMENFDDEWIDAGTRRTAPYMNLPAGPYLFRVQARNRDGVWNEAGASFAFEIAPHYYQTWWFYLTSATLAGCLVFMAYRMRLAQIHSSLENAMHLRIEERERIARELHDTLLQGISGIAMQLRALAPRLPDGEAREQLGEILNRMEQSTKETRLALGDLRLPPENEPDVRTALESFGRMMVQDTEQRFRLEVTGTPVEPPKEIRQDLLRIGQEAILNAARHSQASEIMVVLAFEPPGLAATITDNGIGFDVSARPEAGHWGLVGMRERASRLGGHIEIASTPGAGTRISVEIPYRRS